jgi:eukaryotic-like serine/threonine-protein kinase
MGAESLSHAVPVLGRYRPGTLLGRGATATVRRALDLQTGRQVALKAIPADPDLAPRVAAEVRAARRVAHPGIVPLLDCGEDDGVLYLVWELVEGPTLSRLMASRELGDSEALALIADVLDALAHAHARGVVHRDVKPGNIMVAPDGRARLADFGVARLSGEEGLTNTGDVVGTVAYMAPEQARGHSVGPAGDVYAACLVGYEALTGANPIQHRTPMETYRRAAAAAVPALAEVRADLPTDLVAALSAGLDRDPAVRPRAAELAHTIREHAWALGGPVDRSTRLVRHAPAAASGIGGAVLAVASLGAVSQLSAPEIAGAAVGVAALAAFWPRLAAVAGAAAAVALVGRSSVGAAVPLGIICAIFAVAGWRRGRVMLLPALAPVLAIVGLIPLYAIAVGLTRRTADRVWAILAGLVALVGWQLVDGTVGLLVGPATGKRFLPTIDHTRDPRAVLEQVGAVFVANPWLAGQAAVLVVAALTVPLVVKPRATGARTMAALAWGAALCATAAAVCPRPDVALAATLPSAILVAIWAARPWRHLVRLAGGPASATLRGPSR